jgi:hypothetical protein
MPLLDSLEKRFGRFAIRGIVGYIVFFQCLTFAVLFTKPDFRQVLELRTFSEMSVSGEWWRLLSFMAIPDTGGLRTLGPLMFIFYAGFLLFIMHPLEAALGRFRMNLFVLLYVLLQWLQASLTGTVGGDEFQDDIGGMFYSTSGYLSEDLFFTFAVLYPGVTIRLYGIVPLPAWVLALVSAGLMLTTLISIPQLWLAMTLSLTPFFIFGLPPLISHLRHRSEVAARRSRYRASSLAPSDSFHQCSICRRTDASDPDLDFRVTEDGTEYCTEHLPR